MAAAAPRFVPCMADLNPAVLEPDFRAMTGITPMEFGPEHEPVLAAIRERAEFECFRVPSLTARLDVGITAMVRPKSGGAWTQFGFQWSRNEPPPSEVIERQFGAMLSGALKLAKGYI